MAVRAVLGQQVSVAGPAPARGRLDRGLRRAAADARTAAVTHAVPDAGRRCAEAPGALPMPAVPAAGHCGRWPARSPTASSTSTRAPTAPRPSGGCSRCPGIGPWTASYVALRALRDPDVFLPTDLGVRHALDRLGLPSDPASAAALAESWRPWRSYGLLQLWHSLDRKDV